MINNGCGLKDHLKGVVTPLGSFDIVIPLAVVTPLTVRLPWYPLCVYTYLQPSNEVILRSHITRLSSWPMQLGEAKGTSLGAWLCVKCLNSTICCC